MEFKRSTVSKRVFCCKCKCIGYICGLYLAPKGWRRHFTLTKQKYIYYCQRCYQIYIQGKPLFYGEQVNE